MEQTEKFVKLHKKKFRQKKFHQKSRENSVAHSSEILRGFCLMLH